MRGLYRTDRAHETEFEIDLSSGRTLRLHRLCHKLWLEECGSVADSRYRQYIRASDAPPPRASARDRSRESAAASGIQCDGGIWMIGRVKKKVLPSPILLSAQIRPP